MGLWASAPGDTLRRCCQATDSVTVPYEFEGDSWIDENYVYHDGEPYDLDATYSIRVFAWDPVTGDQKTWWVHSPYPLDSWDDWNDLIEGQMEMHGIY